MAKCKLIRSSIPAKIKLNNAHLAWTNPNPTSSMSSKSIALDTDGDWDRGIVKCKIMYSSSEYFYREFRKSENFIIETNDIANLRLAKRSVVYTDSTHLQFGSGVIRDTFSSTGQMADDTRYVIPIEIYLYKDNPTADVTAIASSVKTSAQNCMMSDGETSVEDALNYSETEHVVGKWIDGSTLYEKTIDFGALPNATTKSKGHGITNLGKVISINGIATKSGAFKPIPYIWNATHIDIEASDSLVYINTSSDMSSYTATYVTLRYTKTS